MPIKRLKTLPSFLLTAFALSASPVLAAGTTPLALVPQLDSSGNVAAGCKLNFFVAGTVSTRQNAFADFGLTQPLPNPLTCDQAGRVPMHWLADGLIHIQLTDSSGGVIVDTTMQTLGPSSGGGGGGGTVDPTTILATGDEKIRYGTGPIAGFVRENGLTIGNATSGASERANADTQNLFIYLYNTDPNLSVSGGRTGNALNDYNASKTIALPDMRGRVNAFLDDMGNSAAGRLTSTYFGTGATTLGAAGGSQSHTLALAELPTGITVTGPISVTSTDSNIPTNAIPFLGQRSDGTIHGWISTGAGTDSATAGAITSTGTASLTSNNTSGSPHSILPPMMLKTVYIKL